MKLPICPRSWRLAPMTATPPFNYWQSAKPTSQHCHKISLSQTTHITLTYSYGWQLPMEKYTTSNPQKIIHDIHTLGSLLSSCLAISSSEGRPPAVTSEARVNVQYDSLLLLAADMVVWLCTLVRSTALQRPHLFVESAKIFEAGWWSTHLMETPFCGVSDWVTGERNWPKQFNLMTINPMQRDKYLVENNLIAYLKICHE